MTSQKTYCQVSYR